jgi:hypothetical protein
MAGGMFARALERLSSMSRRLIAFSGPEPALPAQQDSTGGGGYWPPNEAGSILETREFVVPVLGAGISVDAGMPSSQAVADHIMKKIPAREGEYSDGSSLMAVADEADIDPLDLNKLVAEFVMSSAPAVTDFARAIVHAPSRLIVTFNYDFVLENAADAEGVEYESLVASEQAINDVLSQLTSDVHSEHLTILHIHGRADQPASIVLERDSYQAIANRGRIQDLVFSLMNLRAMCFLGTELNELHFVAMMRQHRGDRRHVLLCRASKRDELVSNLGLSVHRDGVLVETYDQHAELDGFAARLVATVREDIPEGPIAEIEVPSLPFGYVANVLVPHGREVSESDRLASLILGVADGPAPLGEADVALGQRTVVVGAPGSGKSELLKRAGALAPGDEQALLIRCSQLDLIAGEAITVLTRMAETGVGLQQDVVVNREALERHRFHFYFDGLDESSIDQQPVIARAIADVAGAFPQHRFTVASRSIEAISSFPEANEASVDGRWRILELVPDRNWQSSYLSAAGVSLQELEEKMPALRDLAGLLQLPFFLAKTVELYRADALEDFEDLWALVQAFVTDALTRELGLTLPADDARKWLRAVALAMGLSGRTTLAPAELAEIPVPIEVERQIGSSEAIADALVARLLLHNRNGEHGFTHRIIGEALAAEALAEHEPEGELLDAVVPKHNDAIHAVRSDWRVPMAFLLARDARWRDVVKFRDELAAARCTPSSAESVERLNAAQVIWRTYCDFKVWIWEYGAPEILNSAESIGRLLRTDGMDEITAEVRAGIDDESPQVQGNAIRVLSLVNPDGLASDLQRVLEEDHREPVVRREAAIAAREIGAVELLPTIVARAATTSDDSEAQDLSSCAMELAPVDELVNTAIQLAPNRRSRTLATSYLQGRVSAEEIVRYLRAHAEAEPEGFGREAELLEDVVREVLDNG